MIALLAGGGEEGTSLEPGKIPIGGEPRGIAVGEGAIWVARHGDDKVNRIDPATGEQERVSTSAPDPDRIVAGEGAVWVTIADGTQLVRIDPRTRKTTASHPVAVDGRRAEDCTGCPNPGMEIGEDALWVGSTREGRISKRDLHSGAEDARYELPSGYSGALSVNGGAVWAVGYDDDGPDDDGTPRGAWLVRIDAKTGNVGDPIPVGTSISTGVAASGDRAVWITATADTKDVLTLFDPAKEDELDHINFEPETITGEDVVATQDAAFLWDARTASLMQIDRDTIDIASTTKVRGYRTRLGSNITWSDLDVADGFAWVTDAEGGAVFKVDYSGAN